VTDREGVEVCETCAKKFKGQEGAGEEGEAVSHHKYVIHDMKGRIREKDRE
jgi:hypothetical protein